MKTERDTRPYSFPTHPSSLVSQIPLTVQLPYRVVEDPGEANPCEIRHEQPTRCDADSPEQDSGCGRWRTTEAQYPRVPVPGSPTKGHRIALASGSSHRQLHDGGYPPFLPFQPVFGTNTG